MSEVVMISKEAAVGKLTVCRPNAMNALNAEVVSRLSDGFDELAADASTRVIVITGQGEKSFISGADINEFLNAGPAEALDIGRRLKALTDRITHCPKPVLAAINGFCLGGGLEMALACDVRIASDNARFGVPEIKLGIIPGGGAAARLTRLVGGSAARALTMTGDIIDANRAFAIGIVTAIHPVSDFPSAVRALAEKLASYAPFALSQLKSTLNLALDSSVDTTCVAEINAYALCYSTEDQKEGARAFLEKRAPRFTGR